MMPADHPNILLITTDTQRCDTLGCMGSPFAVSPNLDRLAQEGACFDQAHTASPVCLPARSSLLTGVHTPVHDAIENGISRHSHLTVFPDLLNAAGYTNILIGKAHFGPMPASFAVQCVVGEKNAAKDDAYSRHLRKHGYERPHGCPHPVPDTLHMEAFLVDTTIAALDRVVADGRQPFFAFCSLVSSHAPLDPPGRWATLFEGRPLPPLNYMDGEIAGHPAHMHEVLGLARREDENGSQRGQDLDTARVLEARRHYYGLAAYCDFQIGRLLDYLDAAGLRDNTLVIFSSDHGTQLYDHGFSDKHNYYDASWRVPLIMRLPGVLPANARRDFAIWNDLPTTILAAAGLECPTMQGFDLFTPLTRGDPSPRRCAVGTLYKSCAVATERWKLEYYFEEGRGRLFDRENDPAEQVDLYESAPHRRLREELEAALLAWRADLVDVQWLQEHTAGGGPIAQVVARHTRALRGTDAEQRLNERIERINGMGL